MRLRLSPLVPGDLEEIADYIAKDSPRQAVRLLRELRSRMYEIAQQPELYQLRPEIGEGARLALMGHYVILFRIRTNAVRIERVVHGSRNLLRILEAKEIDIG
jgi:plasmid stabilization system protein ParE